MPKLQRIKRSNGSVVFSVNIPLEIIEELDWRKGTELILEIQKLRDSLGIIVFKEKEDIIEEEEKSDG